VSILKKIKRLTNALDEHLNAFEKIIPKGGKARNIKASCKKR